MRLGSPESSLVVLQANLVDQIAMPAQLASTVYIYSIAGTV